MHRAGRLMEAERIYRKILGADSRNPDALHLLGLIANQAGQPEEAIRLIRQAVAANPMAPSYRANLAMVFEQIDDYTQSAQAAREALELDAWNGQALHCLGNALRANDRYEEAADSYEKATRVISDDAALWTNYGSTLLTLERHDEAMAAYRQALAISPGQAQMHSNLGNALAARGQTPEAVAAYREALRVGPGFAPAYTNLAGLLLTTGQTADAATVLKRCLEIDPANTKALAFLAAAAHELEDDGTRRSLIDFDGLMLSRDCEAPPDYASVSDFNDALTQHVTGHGTLAWERVTKTTRKGGQTGELLDESPGPIADLEVLIRTAIADYVEALPDDSEHPFVGSAPDEWQLTIWGTVLGREGHQDPHIHPSGWLSGVYYAAVPPTDSGGHEQAGWIEFGRPPEDFDLTRAPDVRMFEPRPGRMLLFPSYYHHRTVPYEGDGQRVSIAFDVMPGPPGTTPETEVATLSEAEIRSELERAGAMLQAGQLDAAEPVLQRLSKAAPDEPAVHQMIGHARFQRGAIEESAAAFRRAMELAPDDPRHKIDLASCTSRLDHHDESIELLESAAAMDTGSTEALMRLAVVYGDLSDDERMKATYERAIERDPTAGGAHYGLAMAKRYEAGDSQIAQMRQLIDRGGLQPRNEATISFSLGIALDQLDQVDEAMSYYHRGNRIKRTLNPFDIREERRNIARIIDSFPADVFERIGEVGDPSELPVFVIGMPRSGTTLVEQILDSHPAMHGAGELNDLWRIVGSVRRWLPPGASLPEAVAQVEPEGWAALGAGYVKRVERYGGDALRVVDKLPFNYTLAGVIRLMLPQARIVHCVRDPRDTCTSCYLTSFGNDRGFTSDLTELGEAYRLYWQLMRHWQAVLPGGIHEVRYESMVDDVEGESRKLVDYLGMDWSDDCLDYYRNRRAVNTASMTQVRQPAYRSSIGRWRRYEKHLGPLLDALGDLNQYGSETNPT